ncbi:hypothetical protein JCM19274_4980 [Algibacter lectus]|uniref:Uncharacterized protein n=1 Tax=Algibacter lectus TaxID=221126 RepID=A0A090X470_9FLAO|nr:hypothetical protein JCM19274_4980 [Algibacter lectus]
MVFIIKTLKQNKKNNSVFMRKFSVFLHKTFDSNVTPTSKLKREY